MSTSHKVFTPKANKTAVSKQASTISSTATTSYTSTQMQIVSYIEEINYLDPKPVFGPKAALTAFFKLPPEVIPVTDPLQYLPQIDSKRMQSIFIEFKNRFCHKGIQLLNTANWGRIAIFEVQLHVYYC